MKRVKIDLAASGDLVAAVPGSAIEVLGLALSAASGVTVKFQSNAATDLTGAMSLATGTPLVVPVSAPSLPGGGPPAWLRTAAGEKLNLVLGSSVQVSGFLVYREVRE